MSARGSLVTSPTKRSSRLISESSRYIPLFWLGFLSSEDCDGKEVCQFELDRKVAIERAKASLPFLADVFSDIPIFEDAATSLLERLKGFRCKTIGVDIAELTDLDRSPEPDLRMAIETIESRNASFKLHIPARMKDNPFKGGKVKAPARDYSSTVEMLLEICWFSPREIKEAKKEALREIVVGYVWE